MHFSGNIFQWQFLVSESKTFASRATIVESSTLHTTRIIYMHVVKK